MPELPLPAHRKKTAFLAVVVLYETAPEDSVAVASLISNAASECSILLFDNSSRSHNGAGFPEGMHYHAADHNVGVAGAYSFALGMAEREGAKWLLTLDQDTCLPDGFFARLQELAREKERETGIAAIVPHLVQGDKVLSPFRVLPWGIRYLPRGFDGIAKGEIHGLNSGALLRVEALRRIGGFDSRFWLDYQDYSTFRALHRNGGSVWVAGDLQVEHELSLVAGLRSMGEERLRNFLEAESAFIDLSGSWISGLALTGRLAVRWCRQHGRGGNRILRRLTREAMWRRVRLSRNRRLQEWEGAMQRRDEWLAAETSRPNRLFRVSVCMATFNGQAYITGQLESILKQLSEDDEIIVVDDASTDQTCEIIRGLGDNRIRLQEHLSNLGVLRTFEDAICRAHGDVVFLADQDDLWTPEKIASVLEVFSQHPEADIVVSDAALIDETDAVIRNSYYAMRGAFQPGVLANLVRCKYLGCTMAFRSRIREHILPFPAGADVLHDLWIGAANALAGGRVIYIDRPLVLYRRHRENATGATRLPLRRQIRIRWDLCRSLGKAWLNWYLRRNKWNGRSRGGLQ